jgi:hypothetical protein
MKLSIFIAIAFLTLCGKPVWACYKTQLEYEILQTCEVRLLNILDENGVPIARSDWESAESRWVDYLQGTAKTDFDKKNNIPKSARRIYRSGDADTLYCEFDKNGKIVSAYTVPSSWDEAKKRWISKAKIAIETINGQLPNKELHKSEITTCI